MSMGIGKTYLVQLIKFHFGNLDSCIEFMKSNPPSNKYEFYEIRPAVKFEKDGRTYCNEYYCDLLRGQKGRRRKNEQASKKETHEESE